MKGPQAPRPPKPPSLAPDSASAEARPGDSPPGNWVERSPAAIRPYLRLMRLDRPIGIWLLFWPCIFGLVLGATVQGAAFPDPWHVVLMGIGSIVMRGAGCTYNDIIDRDIDAQVARTRGRPIPSGAVSVRAAALFAIALGLAGLLVLLSFNRLTIGLGIGSLVLVGGYPFMKRITWWPQAWLGLTFNWGALLGFTAETGYLGLPALLLYAGCFFWTVGYDTIYGHQDKEDDALIGVKSTSRRLGMHNMPFLYLFYALTFSLILAAGITAGLGFVFALSLLVAGMHLAWQLVTLDVDRPLLCLKLFRTNRDTGALIAAALLLGAVGGF